MIEDRFEQFFDANVADVWRFARRRTTCDADADDVTAETLAVAWRRRADMPPDPDRQWLYAVARHVLDALARTPERRQRLHQRLTAIEPTAVGAPDLPAPWAALAELSEQDQKLLIRAWDDPAGPRR
jgi:DNA-directed RNA polymerase specialized sigma24 family protein